MCRVQIPTECVAIYFSPVPLGKSMISSLLSLPMSKIIVQWATILGEKQFLF